MSHARTLASLALLLITAPLGADEDRAFPAHDVRQIEGWTVHVDVELLSEEHADEGEAALKLLGERLADIARVLPEEKLPPLRKVRIWIDREHELKRMQYHPSAGWLTDHGYNSAMEKAVHIPRTARFLKEVRSGHQPWAVMHELAHAYHDRELGFEEPRIKQVYEAAVERGQYESILRISGRQARHYALTNHKEFFAEMTEAYLGTNDFYPFVSAELRVEDPETYALLRDIWGELQ